MTDTTPKPPRRRQTLGAAFAAPPTPPTAEPADTPTSPTAESTDEQQAAAPPAQAEVSPAPPAPAASRQASNPASNPASKDAPSQARKQATRQAGGGGRGFAATTLMRQRRRRRNPYNDVGQSGVRLPEFLREAVRTTVDLSGGAWSAQALIGAAVEHYLSHVLQVDDDVEQAWVLNGGPPGRRDRYRPRVVVETDDDDPNWL